MTEPGSAPVPAAVDSDRLASAFGRIVDQQQRELSGLVDGVRVRLADLDGLTRRLDSLEPGLRGLAPAVRELGPLVETSAGEISGEVGELAVRLDAVDAALAGVLARLEFLTAAWDDTVGDLARDSALRDVDSDVAAMRSDVALIPEQVDGVIAARVAGLNSGLTGIESRLAALSDAPASGDGPAIAAVQAGVTGLQAYVARVASGVSSLREAVGPLTGTPEALAELAGRLSDVEARLAAAADDAPDLEQTVLPPLRDLAAAVSVVSRSAAGLAESIQEVAIDVAALGSRMADLEGATAPLSVEVSGLRADLDGLRRLLLEELPTGERSVEAAVAEAVRAATVQLSQQQEASEDRLRSHIDEAVLALASVVLAPGATSVASEADPRPAEPPDDPSWAPPPTGSSMAEPVQRVDGPAGETDQDGRRRWFGR